MTSLPIPIVAAMMLTLLAASNHQQLSQNSSGKLFSLVLYTYSASMLFIGLRWSLDMLALMGAAAALAVISTVLLYLAFRSLGRQPVFVLQEDWMHLLPVLLMVGLPWFVLELVDPILVLIKIYYSVLLIKLARDAPVSLQLTQIDCLPNSERALWAAVVLLIFSALIDVVIAVDFILYQGIHAASLVGIVNLIGVLLIGWVIVQAGRGTVENETGAASNGVQAKALSEVDEGPRDDDGGVVLLEQLNTLLIKERLYADTNLNLQKIARKAGVPSRTVSRTINAHMKQNVSQWVNNARVNAVCEVLQDKTISITRAMDEVGFLTKSNFNREFKRVKGCNPSEWRESQQ